MRQLEGMITKVEMKGYGQLEMISYMHHEVHIVPAYIARVGSKFRRSILRAPSDRTISKVSAWSRSRKTWMSHLHLTRHAEP